MFTRAKLLTCPECNETKCQFLFTLHGKICNMCYDRMHPWTGKTQKFIIRDNEFAYQTGTPTPIPVRKESPEEKIRRLERVVHEQGKTIYMLEIALADSINGQLINLYQY